MNYRTYLTALVTVLLASAMGALASHLNPTVWTLVNKYIILVGGQDALVTSIVGILIAVGTAFGTRLKARYHIGLALQMQPGATLQDVRDSAKTFSLTPPPAPAAVDPDLGVRRPPDNFDPLKP